MAIWRYYEEEGGGQADRASNVALSPSFQTFTAKYLGMNIMKKISTTALLPLFLLCLWAMPAGAQTTAGAAAAKSDRAVGTLREVKVISEQIALVMATDSGETLTVLTRPMTSYRKVAPGATGLDAAIKSSSAELRPGDRIFVIGAPGSEAQTFHARAVVLMKASELTEKREREVKLWETGGVMGLVVETFPAERSLTVRAPGRREPLRLVLASGSGLKRMSAGSLKYERARAGRFEEIRAGDRLRARGQMSADGKSFAADEVITGTLKTFFVKVTGVAAGGALFEAQAVEGKESCAIAVTEETQVRALPKDLMTLFAGGGGGDGLSVARAEDLRVGMVISVTALVDDEGDGAAAAAAGAPGRRIVAVSVMLNAEGVLALRR